MRGYGIGTIVVATWLTGMMGCTTEETASAMGTSHGTVKSQLAKARAHLAEALDVPDGEKESRHADV